MPRELKWEKETRANEIERRMFAYYGEGECSLKHESPFQLVVAVVLSAQCTDGAVNKVTPLLFERYGTPQEMAAARLEDIEAIIHPLGFFHAKAVHLIGLAQKLISDYNGEVPQDMKALQTLPGVGRKTANVVMCQAFRDAQGIAVDTHVYRIAHVLNFVGPSADTPAKVETALCKLYPKEDWLYINHQWVHFGREFCRARNPLCDLCFIHDLCPRFIAESAEHAN